ncbi:hypothetical protein FFK22_004765 [Mycobacterium sp. KBS0706]|uniref:hypothetical protein n=1 Tax=Mycobacterium sp. KBS0706 TaxID=2578109 RepID=UPI00110FD837|nr:hypothetical protein [Mycobacterium sp. KBS0706]TSD89832.1 hypothetical protein FFK22_004765 [Mycobacterium sp. KBS0706]
MMSIKSPATALALSLLAAACGQEIPDQKAFPGYAKGPEPAAPASTLVAEVPLSAEALARKTETSRLTLDRTVETMRQRLTQLKQQIVETRSNLDDQGGRRVNPDQYAELQKAERQVSLALGRTRVSTSRNAATVPEQASTINDLSGLIVSVSGLVHTIGEGEPVAAPTLQARVGLPPEEPARAGLSQEQARAGLSPDVDMSRIRASRPLVQEPPAAAPNPIPVPAAPSPAPAPAIPIS